ncbi:MAG TPA: UDP-3-O-(3-hydroxymyristoyl)glucosamine N-acyltransferase [Terriglobia bacterium]|jgi:UDP-3-O-[3-hydroxymyristoyl] glucosamine N-acyltransferase
MKRTAQEIAEYVGGELRGNGQAAVESVASLKNAGQADLSYAEEKYQDGVEATKAGCIIVGSGQFSGKTLILAKNPKLAFARAAAWLLADESNDWSIHPSATVAPDAVIGDRVKIGAGAVIESGAAIGNSTVIEAGCYVGRASKIGEHCTVYPRVVIYKDVEIGNRVIVHAGAVVGADGFGFVRDGKGHIKFPQVGKVVIEDDVEIGANTCIDRGSLETTIIRRGVKLDNLIQIAHNVEIGEYTLIAAQTGISGSSTLGANCLVGGQVGIGEHATIDSNAIIGGQGGVLNGKHIRAGGEVLWGTPVRPLRQFLLEQAYLSRQVKK